jgi:hypothetical protein
VGLASAGCRVFFFFEFVYANPESCRWILRRWRGLVVIACAVEVIVFVIEVEGAFAFGEDELEELIVELRIDREGVPELFAG